MSKSIKKVSFQLPPEEYKLNSEENDTSIIEKKLKEITFGFLRK